MARSVDVTCGYGGDLIITSSGDLQLISDSYTSSAATQQRIIRLLLTTPTVYDSNGNPIGRPDDLNAPQWGAGLSFAVGQNITDDLESQITASILSALAADAGIATNPPPSVTVSGDSSGFLYVSLYCTTVTGQTVTLPSVPLS